MTNKQLAIRAIRELPDDASMDDIVEQLAILESIRKGEEDIDAGRFISHEELKLQVKQWLSK
jgi:predicted transcriptional regulator